MVKFFLEFKLRLNLTNVNLYVQPKKARHETKYIYILCLSVWVFVCLYLINVKTVEPIDLKVV